VPVDVIAELSVRWLRDVTYLVGTAPSSRLKSQAGRSQIFHPTAPTLKEKRVQYFSFQKP